MISEREVYEKEIAATKATLVKLEELVAESMKAVEANNVLLDGYQNILKSLPKQEEIKLEDN
tara:strand:+ start:1786 stop:1971 length:186 start_codon:yes stop_codon:yes gene_type:complete